MLRLIRSSYNQFSTYLERSLKYYLLQTFSGLLFIIRWAMCDYILPLLLLSILIKLGVFPFRFWVVPVLSYQPWSTLWLISTVLKVPPLVILSQTSTPTTPLVLTILQGAILAVYLLKIKAVIATSSLINTSWVGLLSRSIIWVVFIVFYAVILWFTFFLISKLATSNYRRTNQLHLRSPFLFIVVCSLAGVPPFTGFGLKWITVTEISEIIGLLTIWLITILRIRIFFYLSLVLRSFLRAKKYSPSSYFISYYLALSLIHIPGMLILLIICSFTTFSLPFW